MRLQTTDTTIRQILTRSSGYLLPVASHSLQPYRGCALGNSLCGVGCYVQHNSYITRGRPWGSFVEARLNAAESYAAQYERERKWARKAVGRFGIFLSSSTEPFQPIERKAGITRSVLEKMLTLPPDFLILQSHSHHIADYEELYEELAQRMELRCHISIESDRERFPGLPPLGSSVDKRIEAARILRERGIRTVITISPLLPIENPRGFFQRLSQVADAVVIDHYIGGDGSPAGTRTARTRLPAVIAAIDPTSTSLAYRDQIVAIAQEFFPGNVGIEQAGFAGIMLPG